MTEAELIEAVTSYYELIFLAIGLYVSICSGYLAVAYLIGPKLTKLQTVIITTLYTVVALVMVYATQGYMRRVFKYLEELWAVEQFRLEGQTNPIVAAVLPAILGIGIFACLKFMWDVRHPKTK